VNLSFIQENLKRFGIPAWLFYDFRGLDPIALQILELSDKKFRTRRWFYFVPREGDPVKLVHRIEADALDELPGEKILYSSHTELTEMLGKILSGVDRVAMQYSPTSAVPYISRVDAGTVELVRNCGVEVVSSGDLIQALKATLTPKALESHREAASFLYACIQEAFQQIGKKLKKGGTISELSIQKFLLDRFKKNKFVSNHPPIVAVNAHTANPHYAPTKESSFSIKAGDLVLIDAWCKKDEKDAVYADITWTAYIGDRVPQKIQDVFEVVRDARNKALDFLRGRILAGHPVIGYEVDEKTRHYIESKGYAAFFTHRTGHSIGEEVHWIGANMDNFETVEQRRILPRTCFSIEPGIYLKEFGIRSEVDVYVEERHLEVNPPQLQEELVLIKAQ
jgi:Xaa-Pro dipeptidase